MLFLLHMKTNKTLHFFLILLVSLSLSSCKEDPVGPVIFVLPGGIHIETNAGGLIEFDIDANEGDTELRNIVISQKPVGGITTTLLDTTVYGSRARFFYVYDVPDGAEEILMSFTAYDANGLEGATAKRLFVEGNDFLTETTGHQIYSRHSSLLPDAFDIENLDPLILSTLSDSTAVHLTESDDTDDGNPSLALTSLAGNKFVRNNSFNYPEASQNSASNTYESSTPLQVINNIQLDDILVTKYDTINNLYAVIQVTGIQDMTGSDSDRYVFNIKK